MHFDMKVETVLPEILRGRRMVLFLGHVNFTYTYDLKIKMYRSNPLVKKVKYVFTNALATK